MQHPGWYLIAYDIAQPGRLRRLHRVLRAEALAVQESVFLAFGARDEMEQLLDRLESLMNPLEDDLRAYPVSEPATFRISGQGVIRGTLLFGGDQPRQQRADPAAAGWRREAQVIDRSS